MSVVDTAQKHIGSEISMGEAVELVVKKLVSLRFGEGDACRSIVLLADDRMVVSRRLNYDLGGHAKLRSYATSFVKARDFQTASCVYRPWLN